MALLRRNVATRKKDGILSEVDPDRPYPMHRTRLGHAVIVNNVATEQPGSNADVTALKAAYEKVGFDVHVHDNCDAQKMRKVKKFIMDDDSHGDSNCFSLTIICHGNDRGHLLDRDRRKAWDTELFVGELSDVETLVGKPKIMVIQSCRGSQMSEGRPAPTSMLSADDDVRETQSILPDKADMFLAYATVPGYKAHAGDENGSIYLQTFAKYLQSEYMNRPLDRILKMVRQAMVKKVQGTVRMKQCPEERNSLVYDVMFSYYHDKGRGPTRWYSVPAQSQDDTAEKEKELEAMKLEQKKQSEEMERKQRELQKQQREHEQQLKQYEQEEKRKQEEMAKKHKELEQQQKEKEEEHKAATEKLEREMKEMREKMEKLESAKKEAERKLKEENKKKKEEKTGFMKKFNPLVKEEKREETKLKEENKKEKEDRLSLLQKFNPLAKEEKEEKKKEKKLKDENKKDKEEKSDFLQKIKPQVRSKSPVPSRNVEITVLSTFNPRLRWTTETLTVMPSSGEIVMPGWSSLGDPRSLQIFSLSGDTLTKEKSVRFPCQHSDASLLPVKINAKEQLAIACRLCRMIRLTDLRTGDSEVSLGNREYMFEHMCHGESGKIYVRSFDKVLELDASKPMFTGPTKTLHTGITMCDGMCYVPGPTKAIVLSDKRSVTAISVDSNKVLWEASDNTDGDFCQPMGLLYLPKHGVLLVCDGWNHRVLVLDPRDGSHRQTVSMTDYMGDIKDIALHKDGLIMCHTYMNQCKMSHLSLK